VGIAMGVAGSALAIEAADVALFSNDLRNLPFAVELSRRVAWVVAFNIAFALAVKAAVLGLAFTGHITLWISVLADVGSALLVTLHGLAVLRFQAGRAPQRQQLAAECVGRRGLAAAGGGGGCCEAVAGGGQAAAPGGKAACCSSQQDGRKHQHGGCEAVAGGGKSACCGAPAAAEHQQHQHQHQHHGSCGHHAHSAEEPSGHGHSHSHSHKERCCGSHQAATPGGSAVTTLL
jgi:hypothetical protein